MLDGNVNLIENDKNLIAMNATAATFLIVGRDHNGDLFVTKINQVLSMGSVTTWQKVTANGVDIICTPDQRFWVGPDINKNEWKTAVNLTTSDSIYGLSGTTTYSFALGGAASHSTIEAQYKSLFTAYTVTANISYAQRAPSFGLKTSVGKYFANRFLVLDEP